MKRWSPLQLRMLIHYHCYADPWPEPSKPAEEAYHLLKSQGLIAQRDAGEFPTTTEKGGALVSLLLSTPVPETAFIDPRTREVIDV